MVREIETIIVMIKLMHVDFKEWFLVDKECSTNIVMFLLFDLWDYE